jgi:hypothetical protein
MHHECDGEPFQLATVSPLTHLDVVLQTLIHWDEQAEGADSEASYPPSHHNLIPVMLGGDLHNKANGENCTPKGD